MLNDKKPRNFARVYFYRRKVSRETLRSGRITLAELFASTDELKEINSLDKSLMEKVALMESLSPEEKQTIYTMLDAFIGNVN